MPAAITTDQVWRAIEGQMFAVLAHVTPHGQPRPGVTRASAPANTHRRAPSLSPATSSPPFL